MNLAIVENESHHAQHLQTMLKQWSKDHRTLLNVLLFCSAESFLASEIVSYDLVFLDIQLGFMDGVTAAQQLQEQGFEGELVFLTAYSEYVFVGYDVRAFNYLLKPPSYLQIEKCLDYVSAKLHEERYTFRAQGTIVQVPYSSILYFSSANHCTKIVTTEGVFKQMETMRKIHAYLPSQFLFCHRTLIINTDHVLMLNGKELMLSNSETLPVSQTYLQDIRSALLAFAESMR